MADGSLKELQRGRKNSDLLLPKIPRGQTNEAQEAKYHAASLSSSLRRVFNINFDFDFLEMTMDILALIFGIASFVIICMVIDNL
jgi:hypothetical protein